MVSPVRTKKSVLAAPEAAAEMLVTDAERSAVVLVRVTPSPPPSVLPSAVADRAMAKASVAVESEVSASAASTSLICPHIWPAGMVSGETALAAAKSSASASPVRVHKTLTSAVVTPPVSCTVKNTSSPSRGVAVVSSVMESMTVASPESAAMVMVSLPSWLCGNAPVAEMERILRRKSSTPSFRLSSSTP